MSSQITCIAEFVNHIKMLSRIPNHVGINITQSLVDITNVLQFSAMKSIMLKKQ